MPKKLPRLLVSWDPNPLIDIIIRILEPNCATCPRGDEAGITVAKTVDTNGSAALTDIEEITRVTLNAAAGAIVNQAKR